MALRSFSLGLSFVLLTSAACASCAGGSAHPTASSAATPGPTPSPKTSLAAPPAASVSPDATPPVTLAADTRTTTTAGATFEAPKGWLLAKRGDMLVLESPERDLTLTLVETPESDATKAIALAWQRARPEGFTRTPRTTTKPPARDGWDEITQTVYETTAAESREILALAQRKGAVTFVALLDGTVAGVDRRGAQLSTVIASFRAPGVEEESFAGKKALVLDAKKLESFAAFVEDARVKAKVPGVSLAIVQGHKIVLEKGFGSRTLGGKEAVTPSTLFMIGSITKSLTTLMMAKLVDEGRFGWDTPVVDVAPSFALGDADATKKLAMRHTVCACAGLPRQDMSFFFGFSKTTPESRVEEMKTLRPTTAFGETFQYSNLMVSAGGYVAAHAVDPKKPYGPTYDAAMRSRVLDPIGMKSSTFDFGVVATRDHASPHALSTTLDVKALPISIESWIPAIRPAGGLWSSAHDMARWVALELDGGKTLEGKSVVTTANLTERHKPMVRAGEKTSYGLAVMVEKYKGVDLVWHTGGTLGFNAIALWLPQHDVGFVLLTNLAGAGSVMNAARRRLFELLFDGKDEARQSFEFSLGRRAQAYAAEYGKLDRAPDQAFATKIAGDYQNATLGRVSIRWDKGRAVLDAGDWKSPFGRITEEGTEKLVMLEPPWANFDFVVKGEGEAATLMLDGGQEKYTFSRTLAKR